LSGIPRRRNMDRVIGCLMGVLLLAVPAIAEIGVQVPTESPKNGVKSATTIQAAPSALQETRVNSLGMTFRYIPPGNFMMGSGSKEPGRDRDETRHEVTLTRGFYMQTTETTQKQWRDAMGTNPSTFVQCGGECPVESVSWDEVQEFIKQLNSRDANVQYRLPTEAEWEYACRAGSDSAIYSGDMPILGELNAPALDPIAWYGGNSCTEYPGARNCSQWRQRQSSCNSCGPHKVGLKAPNAWGLYDMLGNVYEWCQDYFAAYPSGRATDPPGSAKGTRRIARGGAWDHLARNCRSANRSHFAAQEQKDYIGFRLVMMFR
jgi:formylglycine-generating enzyme required for sulfatase activity